MKEIEEFLKYSRLFSIYKELLSDKQKEYMVAFFEEDNSFSEIAEALNVSRQAVFDNIKRVCSKLDDFENKLKILQKEEEFIKILYDIKNNLNEKYLDEVIGRMKGY